jgi:hypothetical protein
MTERLSRALQQLPPEQIEKVADFAEMLASQQPAKPAAGTARLSLDWVGTAAALKQYYASGVDAAHDASNIIAEKYQPKPSPRG